MLEACRGVVPLVAVANKVDLVGDGSSTVEALDMVVPQEELKLNWWRLSCKTGEGFQELIDHMEVCNFKFKISNSNSSDPASDPVYILTLCYPPVGCEGPF